MLKLIFILKVLSIAAVIGAASVAVLVSRAGCWLFGCYYVDMIGGGYCLNCKADAKDMIDGVFHRRSFER